MEEIEIPQYFICPISLQIMKDPVTVVSGITYDRDSIERWFLATKEALCPVTKQPLPEGNHVTPNHTLRRLIQQWCKQNAAKGVDSIPTLRLPLNKIYVTRIIQDLGVLHLQLTALKKLEALAWDENDQMHTMATMAEAGIPKAMVLFIVRCFKEGDTNGVLKALKILGRVWSRVGDDHESKLVVNGNNDFLDSLTWVLRFDHDHDHDQGPNPDRDDHAVVVKNEAMLVLRMTMEIISASQLERLKVEFFKSVVMVLKEKKISKQAIKYALHVLIEACPWGRNRIKMVESGAIFQLIELELTNPENHITELIFNLLANLCGCADGRAQLLGHGGGMALVCKRILRISPATDDRALHILSLIMMFSATHEVLGEMLVVGGVSKLCMVMQADCAAYLKKKVRGILRLHSNVWSNSPCIMLHIL